jgi:hypothetical protein
MFRRARPRPENAPPPRNCPSVTDAESSSISEHWRRRSLQDRTPLRMQVAEFVLGSRLHSVRGLHCGRSAGSRRRKGARAHVAAIACWRLRASGFCPARAASAERTACAGRGLALARDARRAGLRCDLAHSVMKVARRSKPPWWAARGRSARSRDCDLRTRLPVRFRSHFDYNCRKPWRQESWP